MKVDAATGGIDAAGDTVYVTTGNGATVTHIADRPLERGIPISVGSGGVYAGDGQGIWVASSLPKGHGTLRYIAEDQTQSRGQAIDLGDLKPVKLLADDDRVWLLGTTPDKTTPDKTRGELVEVVPNELKRQTG